LPPGASLIHAQTTKIDGDPAGILEYTMPFENAGMSAWMHAWSICFVLDRALIQIQFGIVGPAGSEAEAATRMAAHKPLFRLIANSIVFPDKWTSTGATVAPPVEGGARAGASGHAGPPLIPALVGIVAMWGIGLTPAVVIRYFARRPLRRRNAF